MSDKEGLYKHARRGWLWGGVEQFAQQGLSAITGIVLARLLDPSAFGLIASVGIFLSIAQQLIDGGIAQRIIQKPKLLEEDYCALFWCNALISTVCTGLLVIFSGSIARFYGRPELQNIVIVMAFVIFIMRAGRVQETLLNRELRFRAIAVIRTISVLVGCATGLIMAFTGCGVWAILGKQLAIAIAAAFALWLYVPWKPSRKLSFAAVKDLYGYGIPVMLSQTARAFAGQLINVIIAKRVSTTALGFFDRGKFFPETIGWSLANIFTRTNFPVLAKLQHDEEAFRAAYLRFLGVTMALSLMLMAGLAVCARDITQVLLGEKWLPCVWFLQANCISFSIYILFLANAEALRSKGHVGLFFRHNMICAALQIVGVVVGVPWGAEGMMVGDILAKGIVCVLLMIGVAGVSRVTVLSQLKALIRPLVGTTLVCFVLWIVKLLNLPLWPRFMLSGLLGLCILGLYWYVMKSSGRESSSIGFVKNGDEPKDSDKRLAESLAGDDVAESL